MNLRKMNPKLRATLTEAIESEGWHRRTKDRMLRQMSEVPDGTRLEPSSEDVFDTTPEEKLGPVDSVVLSVDFFFG